MNKINLIYLVLAVLLIPFLPQIHAQQQESTAKIPDILIFVQTFLIDSEKNLVAYLTSSQLSYVNTESLHPFLNSISSDGDRIIQVNGQNFQVIKREQTVFSQSESVVASTLLVETINQNPVLLAKFTHDGFPITENDQITTIWTFIRPI